MSNDVLTTKNGGIYNIDSGSITASPITDLDITNKKYVDDKFLKTTFLVYSPRGNGVCEKQLNIIVFSWTTNVLDAAIGSGVYNNSLIAQITDAEYRPNRMITLPVMNRGYCVGSMLIDSLGNNSIGITQSVPAGSQLTVLGSWFTY